MTADTFQTEAASAARDMEPVLAAWLQHLVNNRLHVVLGNIELARNGDAVGVCLDRAEQAARQLRAEVMDLTAHSVEGWK